MQSVRLALIVGLLCVVSRAIPIEPAPFPVSSYEIAHASLSIRNPSVFWSGADNSTLRLWLEALFIHLPQPCNTKVTARPQAPCMEPSAASRPWRLQCELPTSTNGSAHQGRDAVKRASWTVRPAVLPVITDGAPSVFRVAAAHASHGTVQALGPPGSRQDQQPGGEPASVGEADPVPVDARALEVLHSSLPASWRTTARGMGPALASHPRVVALLLPAAISSGQQRGLGSQDQDHDQDHNQDQDQGEDGGAEWSSAVKREGVQVEVRPRCGAGVKGPSVSGGSQPESPPVEWARAAGAAAHFTTGDDPVMHCSAVLADTGAPLWRERTAPRGTSHGQDLKESSPQQGHDGDTHWSQDEGHGRALAMHRSADAAARSCLEVEGGKGDSGNRAPWPVKGAPGAHGVQHAIGSGGAQPVGTDWVSGTQGGTSFAEEVSMLQSGAQGGLHARSRAAVAARAAARSLSRSQHLASHGFAGLAGLLKPVMDTLLEPVTSIIGGVMGSALGGALDENLGQGADPGLVSEVNALLTHSLAGSLAEQVAAPLGETAGEAVSESSARLIEQMVSERVAEPAADRIAREAAAAIIPEAAARLTAEVSEAVAVPLARTLQHTLVRSVTQATVPALTLALRRQPEEDWFCSLCASTGEYCSQCPAAPEGSPGAKDPPEGAGWVQGAATSAQLAQAHYYAAYYGAYYAAIGDSEPLGAVVPPQEKEGKEADGGKGEK